MNISSASTTYDNSFYVRKTFYEQISDKKNSSESKTPNTVKEEKEKKSIENLKQRDSEVKAHEQAHMNAAGSLASPPKYKTKTGPDGKQYAVSGSVNIDTSEGRTPEETIAKAKIIKKAALAPKNPSAQDYKVAQKASQMEASAMAELAQKKQEGMREYGISNENNQNDFNLLKTEKIDGSNNNQNIDLNKTDNENFKNNQNINIKHEELSFDKKLFHPRIDFLA